MSGNDDGEKNKGELKAWDLFRNMVALSNGVEEHAKAAEREACCAAVLGGGDSRLDSLDALTAHTEAVERYVNAARKYLEQLRALAEAEKGGHTHLQIAEALEYFNLKYSNGEGIRI